MHMSCVEQSLCFYCSMGRLGFFVTHEEELFSEVLWPLVWECDYFANVPHDPGVSKSLVQQWTGFMLNET